MHRLGAYRPNVMSSTLITEELIDVAQNAPGFLLWQMEMCWQRTINKALQNLDLTYTQFVVLSTCWKLAKNNKEVYQHQVARHARIDRMMTSRILSSLEKKAYLTRLKIDGDARAKSVILTKKGAEVLILSFKVVSAVESTFFAAQDEKFTRSMSRILSDCKN